MSTASRRLAVLERALVTTAQKRVDAFWNAVDRALGPDLARRLCEDQPDPEALAAYQHLFDTDPTVQHAWRAYVRCLDARFIAIRCNAPPLPADANLLAQIQGTTPDEVTQPQ